MPGVEAAANGVGRRREADLASSLGQPVPAHVPGTVGSLPSFVDLPDPRPDPVVEREPRIETPASRLRSGPTCPWRRSAVPSTARPTVRHRRSGPMPRNHRRSSRHGSRVPAVAANHRNYRPEARVQPPWKLQIAFHDVSHRTRSGRQIVRQPRRGLVLGLLASALKIPLDMSTACRYIKIRRHAVGKTLLQARSSTNQRIRSERHPVRRRTTARTRRYAQCDPFRSRLPS